MPGASGAGRSDANDPAADIGCIEISQRSKPLTRSSPIGYAVALARGKRMQFDRRRRREFITLLGGAVAAAAWPLATRAQQLNRVQRIGVLMGNAENDDEGQSGVAAFRDELRKAGWTEHRNIEIDTRWAAMDVESMRRFAKELVGLQPDLILTSSTPATGAMLQQTRTIPIVFVLVADPVGSGYVASLPRPGGNVTGFTPIVGSLGGKWVQLLKEIAQGLARVALLFNPPTATFVEGYLNPFKTAAASLGMEAIIAPVQDIPAVESLVVAQAREPNSGLVVIPDAFTVGHRAEITSLAARYRIPAIYWSRSSAALGGLISYGPYIVDEYRRAASYADRILKGAKPSELPVQAPTKFELIINLKTAKTLGLEIPATLLARADEVIE
jgi:putative tryptophan/tyrosine transport system substrate-binding protein